MSRSPRQTTSARTATKRDLTRIQDLQVSAVRRVSQTVARILPPLPRAPLADRLPAAKDLVDDGFARAQRLLESQHRFALALVEAVEPVTRRIGERRGPKRKESLRRPATARMRKVEVGAASESKETGAS
jgi:hypothetical protein